AEKHSNEEVFDGLLVPVLASARRDLSSGELTEPDMASILDRMRKLLGDWPLGSVHETNHETGAGPATGKPVRLLAVAARDDIDAAAMQMAQLLLDPVKWQVELVGPEALPAEIVAAIDEQEVPAIIIGAVQPGSLVRVRYLCKQLRKHTPT